jgi:cell division protein FtsQ
MAAAAALPADVRLMNGVAAGVFALAAVVLLAAGARALVRSPWFPIRAIQLEGDLQRNSATTIRANTTPHLAGSFFSVDLRAAREVFEGVPWVRHAVVRRVWPDRLAVRLEEHRPAALWEEGDGGEERLVNTQGEVFDANVGAVEEDDLPRLAGPEGTSAQMLGMLNRLQPVFAPLDLRIERLALSGRGSWRAEFDDRSTIEIGRGSDDEVVARVARFVRTLPRVTARFKAPLAAADLRHADGYAVRLRGVTTTATQAGSAPARSN